jgi:hypothetical protein
MYCIVTNSTGSRSILRHLLLFCIPWNELGGCGLRIPAMHL